MTSAWTDKGEADPKGGPMAHPVAGRVAFPTTHWTLVFAAQADGTTESTAAVEALCRTYGYPLYAYLRRSGREPVQARDQIQAFFAHLQHTRSLSSVHPTQGAFRNFLLRELLTFIGTGPEQTHQPEDPEKLGPVLMDPAEAETTYQQEPDDAASPEALYRRRWALHVLHQAQGNLRHEMAAKGQSLVFDALFPALLNEQGAPSVLPPGTSIGLRPRALRSTLRRMRKRFRHHLRAVIAETVTRDEDIETEIRDLLSGLSGKGESAP